MSLLTQQPGPRPFALTGGGLRGPAALLASLYGEWKVRREIASAQMLDGASLRDIGVARGGLESAIRNGRKRQS
jgi:hypothetical protein